MAKSKLMKSTLARYPNYVAEIGMITVEFANAEVMFGSLLAALLRVEGALGEVIYLTPKVTIGRLEILENVLQDFFDENFPEHKNIGSLIGRMKGIISKRHGIIHGAWAVLPDHEEPVHQISLPIRRNPKTTPTSLKSLSSLVSDIRLLCQDVHDTTERVIRLPPSAWPPAT